MSNNKEQKQLGLFLDASTPLFYIAIKDLKSGFIEERKFDHKTLKGEALLSVVNKMFDDRGYDVLSLRYLCTTKGPGSLTGLRIVMSILKTLAQILNIPIVCLPTLYAIEQSYERINATVPNKVLTCLAARKNVFYVRFSDRNEQSFETISKEILLETMKDANIMLWAEGSLQVELCDKEADNSVIIELSPQRIFQICDNRYEKKLFFNYIDCKPEYAGKSVAERNFEKSGK